MTQGAEPRKQRSDRCRGALGDRAETGAMPAGRLRRRDTLRLMAPRLMAPPPLLPPPVPPPPITNKDLPE